MYTLRTYRIGQSTVLEKTCHIRRSFLVAKVSKVYYVQGADKEALWAIDEGLKALFGVTVDESTGRTPRG